MTVTIRPVTEEEMLEATYIGKQAFSGGNRDMGGMADPNRPERALYGVYDTRGMQARVAVIAYHIHLGPNIVVPMGGVAGVACLPASRGKGYVGMAIQYMLEQMRDKGQVVSTLFPFAWDFYRKHGWEWVGLHRRYTVPTKILKSDPNVENVVAATLEDRQRVIDCYTAFSGRYRGMIQRDAKHWNTLLDDEEKTFTYTYLYEQDGQVEGYLTHNGWDGSQTRIREFISLTPRAQRAFLALLRRQEMQMEKFQWYAPDDDKLYHHYYHWDMETTLSPKCQGRVVDVAGALNALKPAEANGTFTFALNDPQCDWNGGTWRVEFGEGAVHATRSEQTPHVSLDIQALSQCYFGTPTVAQLRHAERLTVHDETGFAAFQRLFDGPPMWMNDSF